MPVVNKFFMRKPWGGAGAVAGSSAMDGNFEHLLCSGFAKAVYGSGHPCRNDVLSQACV
jgi:hypothetical protein